jgi:hypothetical protein
MFTRQAPLIANNLWQGGLAQPQASAVTNALGQCNTPLEHRAAVTVDTTTPDMTLVTPETTIFKFPTGDMLPPEPKAPRPGPFTPEELPPFQPQPFDPYTNPFQPVNNYYNETTQYPSQTVVSELEAQAGKYLRVPSEAKVELAYKDDKDKNICTFEGGEIVGLTIEKLMDEFENHINNPDGTEEPGRNRVLTVVTDVKLVDGFLRIEKSEGVYVLNAGGDAFSEIETEDCNASGN